MSTTPQERLALGVVALLLAAGAGARAIRSEAPPAEWSGAGAAADGHQALAGLRQETERAADDQARRGRPLAGGEKIDPNTAPAAELDRLPRVGPGLAERIVAWRTERGPFRTLADLDSVPGVGPAVLAAVAPHVTLPPAPSSTAPPPRGGADPRPSRAAGARPPPGPAAAVVDVNTATAAELTALPGIGPALAARIVEFRERHGPFRAVEELARVRGIGPATVERLRPRVRATP